MALFGTRRIPILVLAVVIAGVVLTHTLWLGALGKYLIEAEPPIHADYAVVLAGDFYGHRVLEGGELVRQGYVRKALVSGPRWCYGVPESDLAIRFAERHGYPGDSFINFPTGATSTFTEAEEVVPELRRLGAHSFLLVTSDYHTRRAARLFRQFIGDLKMQVVAAPDEYFRWNSWWRNREGRKTFFLEWAKTLSSYFGI